MTEQEWVKHSHDWQAGWRAGQSGADLHMTKDEIAAMPDDWIEGLHYAVQNPFGDCYSVSPTQVNGNKRQ